MAWVDRKIYLDRLRTMAGTQDIKVITGMRRSGKSELMKDFVAELSRNDLNTNNVYIDLSDLRYEELLEYHKLHEHIDNSYIDGKHNRIFVDEVQMCQGFEKVFNSLHSQGMWDIYLTGSNAFLLSSDLATLFTGRQREVHVLPFSFAEYRAYFNSDEPIDTDLDSYVVKGGLAGSYAYSDETDAKGYIQDVYKTILTRDLLEKYQVEDRYLLENLSSYLLDNTANLNSVKSLADTISATYQKTNHVTVGRYVKILQDAYLTYEARRFDIRGKKYLASSSKHYVCDTGVRFAVLGNRNMDWGRMYETIVFLELKRRGYDVYVGKLYQKEIDFVVQNSSQLIYIQVSDDISRASTLDREVAPLLSIKDAYPKVLLARTGHPTYTHEGVLILDIAGWLLGEQSF